MHNLQYVFVVAGKLVVNPLLLNFWERKKKEIANVGLRERTSLALALSRS
jgi:hypothetical protein